MAAKSASRLLMSSITAPLKDSNLNTDNRCLSVVVPVYNEAVTITKIVSAVLEQPMVAELIAVDDGSSDKTSELLQALQAGNPRIILRRHETNRGKEIGRASCRERV